MPIIPHLRIEPMIGCVLAPGQAMTLRPRQPGELRVRHGTLWVTPDGPHASEDVRLGGDMFLCAGDRFRLATGQPLVLEPARAKRAATFDWVPLSAAESWRTSVRAPAAELQAALRQTGRAALRLLHGLGIWGGRSLRAPWFG
jgi:hypothetical protein